MKLKNLFLLQKCVQSLIIIFIILGFAPSTHASVFIQTQDQQVDIDYVEYSGMVVDNQTNEPLVFATLEVKGTNISTITNSDGEFILKIPKDLTTVEVTISFIGYIKKTIPIRKYANWFTIIFFGII